MKKSWFALLVLGVCLGSTSARAFDMVRTTTEAVYGKVVRMSPQQVVVEKGTGGLQQEIPVNEIITIYYDDDPALLKAARGHLAEGRLEDALAALEKINPAQLSLPQIRQDVEYYTAYCKAQLALGGSGDVAEAGRQMYAFVQNNPGSYHWLEANEIVGNLLVANGQYAQATAFYERVAQAPWPDYQMRAGVAKGNALLAEAVALQSNPATAQQAAEKLTQAQRTFDQVLSLNVTGPLAASQRMAATLGKARILAAQQKFDEALKLVEPVIASGDPENTELMARAYNTLGAALRRGGKPKDAALAFLHVHLLYFAIPDAHAEALYNLAQLWDELKMPERAVEARTLLTQRYANSRWAKMDKAQH